MSQTTNHDFEAFESKGDDSCGLFAYVTMPATAKSDPTTPTVLMKQMNYVKLIYMGVFVTPALIDAYIKLYYYKEQKRPIANCNPSSYP